MYKTDKKIIFGTIKLTKIHNHVRVYLDKSQQ